MTGTPDAGFPESLPLVGTGEIGKMFGVTTRSGAHKVTLRPGFPQPVARLAGGHVWWGPAVEGYLKRCDAARAVLGRPDRRYGRPGRDG